MQARYYTCKGLLGNLLSWDVAGFKTSKDFPRSPKIKIVIIPYYITNHFIHSSNNISVISMTCDLSSIIKKPVLYEQVVNISAGWKRKC